MFNLSHFVNIIYNQFMNSRVITTLAEVKSSGRSSSLDRPRRCSDPEVFDGVPLLLPTQLMLTVEPPGTSSSSTVPADDPACVRVDFDGAMVVTSSVVVGTIVVCSPYQPRISSIVSRA